MNLQPVINKINSMRCPVHHQHPKATQTGDKVNIKACCEEFRASTMEALKTGMAQAARDEIMSAFKKR
jgi:hypothetical protein